MEEELGKKKIALCVCVACMHDKFQKQEEDEIRSASCQLHDLENKKDKRFSLFRRAYVLLLIVDKNDRRRLCGGT